MFSDEASVRHFPICERNNGRFMKDIKSAKLSGNGYTPKQLSSAKNSSSKGVSISGSLSKAIYGLRAARNNQIVTSR